MFIALEVEIVVPGAAATGLPFEFQARLLKWVLTGQDSQNAPTENNIGPRLVSRIRAGD